MTCVTWRRYQLTTFFKYARNRKNVNNFSPKNYFHIRNSSFAVREGRGHYTIRGGISSETFSPCHQLANTTCHPHRYFFHGCSLLTNLPSLSQVGEAENMNDKDYMEFLNKANEIDVQSHGSDKLELKSLDQSLEIPEALQKVTQDAYYISDADEPFVPVVLRVNDGIPDEIAFAKLINHPEPAHAEVRIMDTKKWDPHGQYKNIIDSVKDVAQNNQIRVYQIVLSNTMSEYWLVGVKDKLLLGVKALAVES